MNFEGKVALVTGGASGIGRATARRFAELGASVVISDLDGQNGSAAAAELRARGARCIFVGCDVSDPRQVVHLLDLALSFFPRLDFAVNNAGIGGPWEPLQTYPHEGWDSVLAVNLTGVFYCMQQEIKRMIGNGGAIVNVASIAGKRGLPYQAAYTASKHAVIGLTRVSAQEVARHDIRVNAVCPAYTDTPLITPLIAGNSRRVEKMLERIPMRRFGKPGDIAEAIVWLCSDESSFVTGQAVNLDGGMTA